jgi:BNR/Asp-box repeat protein
MSLTTFFRPRNHASRQRPPRSRLQVERLEDRAVPSANIDISHTSGFDIETNIDLNPVNPQNLVATAIHANFNGFFPPFADGAYFSRDGGRTWSASSPLPLSFQGVDYPTSVDPTVAFDSRGNVYVAYDAITIGPSGPIAAALIVAKSTDGGATFTQFTSPATTAANPDIFLDHPKVAVDRSSASPFRDNVYMTWITGPTTVGPQTIVESRSTDGGLTWSAPQTLDSFDLGIEFNTQTVGPDGTVYLSWTRFDLAGHSTQFVASSTDGGVSFGSPVLVTTLNALPDFVGEEFSSPAQSFIAAQASLDTDRSAGPFRGRLYMAYIDRPDPDARPFDEDIYLQFSDDHGQTWSPRQRVNDDGIGNSQFFPSLSVDPTNGKVLISWYDTRRDPVNIEKTDVFLAVGTPGSHGVQWQPNMRVTNKQSDESVNNLQAIGTYGDYEGLVAYGGVAHPVWSDARADNFAAGLSEEVFTTAVRYGGEQDDDSGNTLAAATLEQQAPALSQPTILSAGKPTVLPLPSASDDADRSESAAAQPSNDQTIVVRRAKRRSFAALLDDWDGLESAAEGDTSVEL